MRRIVNASTVVLFLLVWSQGVQAQYLTRWVSVNAYHAEYNEVGMWGDTSPQWEGIEPYSTWGSTVWDFVGVKNIRDIDGSPGPVFEVFPRTVQGGGFVTISGEQARWTKEPFKLVARRPQTEVSVNGLPTFLRVQNIDEIDPSLTADRMFVGTYGSWMGIEIQHRIYAFASGSGPHGNYHIVETTLTNTGNTDPDPEIEEERTLKGVYYSRNNKKQGMPSLVAWNTYGGYAWSGAQDVGRTLESVDNSPDYDVDFSSIYSWGGYQNQFTEWSAIGGAIMRAGYRVPPWDTTGRLAGAGMIGEADVYAPSRSMGPDETVRDVSDAGDAQPSGTRVQRAGSKPGSWYGWEGVSGGHIKPGQWYDQIECPREEFPGLTWEQRMSKCESNDVANPWNYHMNYGPYTLEPGEHVTFVNVRAVDGLSQEAKYEIGRQYKRNWERNLPLHETTITYDANGDGKITNTNVDGAEGDEKMTKNMWVFSSRDSLFQTFQAGRAAWKAGLKVPERPVQPKSFSVDAQPNRVQLRWTLFNDAPVPDSFAVYRTDVSFRTVHDHVATVEASEGQREYSYGDREVERGVGYYYYLQAIDQTETSPADFTPVGTTLRSSRYWTQTYTPVRLVRSPGAKLEDVRVVPNPLHVNANKSVRYPDQATRIGFLDIPGQCTIKIFTELGELVRTIEHTNGSGDEYWNLTTESNQVAQSGIYLAVITDHETGNQITRGFTIVR